MTDQRGLLREGFSRTWQYQRVLWFMFFISLVLGHFSAGPATHKLDGATDHSIYSQRLSQSFDLGAFSELASNPEVKLFEVAGVSGGFALIFLVFVLFLTGGILEAYRSGRKLTTREFFEACGSYFWRWVRLLFMMLVVVIPILMLIMPLREKTSSMMLSAYEEKAAFWILLAGLGAIAFVLMCIRLWFDMAQVRAVVEEETGMLRNTGLALKLTSNNFGTLFWMYFRISLLGWLVVALGIYIWMRMSPPNSLWTFLILELVILIGFGVRLWQRACEMIWYQRRYLAPLQAPVPVPVIPSPTPLVTIAPPPISP
jgi:hypothetical protein